MKTAEETFYELIKEKFPFITKEKFKESLEKSDLLSCALVAMKNYASEAIDEAKNIQFSRFKNFDIMNVEKAILGIKDRLK
jgi:hypothetical protein